MKKAPPALRDLSRSMLDAIGGTLSRVDPAEVSALIDRIASARAVFVCGAGRSGLVVRAFAQRVMQLGKPTYVVGDTTAPRARPGDLVIAASFTGERATTLAIVRQANNARVRVCAILGKPNSPLARAADLRVLIPVPRRAGPSAFLGASLFEDSLLILLDAIALLLSSRKGLSRRIETRHANLE